jgi:hypothetical protein
MKYLFLFCCISQLVFAQFAPPHGQPGSTAMYKDSSAFAAWATSAKIVRGLQNISNPSSGHATVGDSTSPVGIADGTVVSLGDSGYAICSFQNEIYDGPGYDFAVFENSFDGNYLELGFVEVSSDGVNFFRFPTTSNTQDTIQTGAFANTDARKVNNLAGKYIAQYGTPFDLSEIQGTIGLDVNHIKRIKVIDVIGSITTQYATYDENNHKVNDPWPTPYASCGFDLDAIGVINQHTNGIHQVADINNQVIVYPNPASKNLTLTFSKGEGTTTIYIYDMLGKLVVQHLYILPSDGQGETIDVSGLAEGVYQFRMQNVEFTSTQKIIITKP